MSGGEDVVLAGHEWSHDLAVGGCLVVNLRDSASSIRCQQRESAVDANARQVNKRMGIEVSRTYP